MSDEEMIKFMASLNQLFENKIRESDHRVVVVPEKSFLKNLLEKTRNKEIGWVSCGDSELSRGLAEGWYFRDIKGFVTTLNGFKLFSVHREIGISWFGYRPPSYSYPFLLIIKKEDKSVTLEDDKGLFKPKYIRYLFNFLN